MTRSKMLSCVTCCEDRARMANEVPEHDASMNGHDAPEIAVSESIEFHLSTPHA